MKARIKVMSLVLAGLMPIPAVDAMFSEYFSPSVQLPNFPTYTPQQLPELQGYLPSYLMPSKLFIGVAGASFAALTTYLAYKEYKRRTAPKTQIMASILDTANTDVTTLFEFLWLFNNSYTHRLVTKNFIGRMFSKSKELSVYNKYNRDFMQEHTTGIRYLNVANFPKVKKLLADADLLRTGQNAHLIKRLESYIIGLYKAISDANWEMQGWLLTTKTMDQKKFSAIVGNVAIQFQGIYKTLEDLYKKLDIPDQKLPGKFIDSIGTDRTIHKVNKVWLIATTQDRTIEDLIRILPANSNNEILEQHFLPAANIGAVKSIATEYEPKPKAGS